MLAQRRNFAPPPHFSFAILGNVILFIAPITGCGKEMAIGPKLGPIPSCAVDLGVGDFNEVLSGSIPIENTGTAPLIFFFSGNCGCTEFNPQSGTLAPGQSRNIDFKMRLRNLGKTELVRIGVKTNENCASDQGFTVTARCRSPINAQPSAVDFGTVDQRQSVERTLQLLDENGNAISFHKTITYQSSTSNVAIAPLDHGRLKITLQESAPEGVLGESLTIVYQGLHSLTIPISGIVQAPVMVAPRTVILRNDGRRWFSRALVWRSNAKDTMIPQVISRIPAGVGIEIQGGTTRSMILISSADKLPKPMTVELKYPSGEIGSFDIVTE